MEIIGKRAALVTGKPTVTLDGKRHAAQQPGATLLVEVQEDGKAVVQEAIDELPQAAR